MFLKIDNWLFEKIFQPFSDSFVTYTGRGPLWLAGTCALTYVLFTGFRQVFYESNIMVDVFLCLVGLAQMFTLDEEEKYGPRLTLNPRRRSKSEYYLRLFVLPLVPLYVLEILSSVTSEKILGLSRVLTFGGILYFSACETTPPPPPKPKNKFVKATA